MKKYLALVSLFIFVLSGVVYFFNSKESESYTLNSEPKWTNGTVPKTNSSQRATASESKIKDSRDSHKNSDPNLGDSIDSPTNDASVASSPKYYNVQIKDNYEPAPKHVLEALKKEEIKLTAVAKKAQLEGDTLVSCVSRESACISGSNESKNCVTQLRNCVESSSHKLLTELQLIESMGRKSYEKYRNHLEFIEKTGSSIRAPGSLEKF